ncbi:hypothetical protein [Microbacterium sp.]|uniref:hypothetical protein n=1 Tax=Microbacterium sp. TaxID=51671 RepID=UPI0028111CA5|nr:hypothetical protein [Microbacterium sp.]
MIVSTAPLRLLTAAAAGAVTLSLLAACTPQPEPTPTKTALFETEEEAFAAAEKTYREYIKALDSVSFSDPGSFEPALAYTTGEVRSTDKEFLSEMHANGYSQTGKTAVVWFRGTKYAADDALIQAEACLDQADLDIKDASGSSVVPADRPDQYVLALQFEVSEDSVLLANSTPREGESCAS